MKAAIMPPSSHPENSLRHEDQGFEERCDGVSPKGLREARTASVCIRISNGALLLSSFKTTNGRY